MGIDVGSACSKCVVLTTAREIAGDAVIFAGAGTGGPDRAMAAALEKAGADRSRILRTAATGYGRKLLENAGLKVSEVSCHAKGAAYLFPGVRTVIDIGGQDAKAILLDADGRLVNFVMNDKCAAGTGRFLEVMARILDRSLEEMSDLDLKARCAAVISSACTVFAESEVISQLSAGTPAAELVAGINRSAAARAASLAKRLGVFPPICMTGGVAGNGGVRRAMEKELAAEILYSPLSQLAGALGAALYAADDRAAK
ncbi:MAG: acyl-CoA dehydratase activase [Clostridiales Family XIII bacterium]|jgi:predicted CoA-substrate-specific enzyme activase|nr:acyl-CoA dehydratase activase [Clostridiales Family XIII bacterium]